MAPISEEVGKTSRELISVFHSSPLLLAVLVFNFLFMGMILWMVHTGGERWERALKICQEHNLGGVEIK